MSYLLNRLTTFDVQIDHARSSGGKEAAPIPEPAMKKLSSPPVIASSATREQERTCSHTRGHVHTLGEIGACALGVASYAASIGVDIHNRRPRKSVWAPTPPYIQTDKQTQELVPGTAAPRTPAMCCQERCGAVCSAESHPCPARNAHAPACYAHSSNFTRARAPATHGTMSVNRQVLYKLQHDDTLPTHSCGSEPIKPTK